jgi:hypothetical protein
MSHVFVLMYRASLNILVAYGRSTGTFDSLCTTWNMRYEQLLRGVRHRIVWREGSNEEYFKIALCFGYSQNAHSLMSVSTVSPEKRVSTYRDALVPPQMRNLTRRPRTTKQMDSLTWKGASNLCCSPYVIAVIKPLSMRCKQVARLKDTKILLILSWKSESLFSFWGSWGHRGVQYWVMSWENSMIP